MSVRTAALVGANDDPLDGPRLERGLHARDLWGEIACRPAGRSGLMRGSAWRAVLRVDGGVTLKTVGSASGRDAKAKFANTTLRDEHDEQPRKPIEDLVEGLARLCGLPAKSLTLVGETHLSDLKTRPDFAVTIHDELAGFIEVKAPGKGADPPVHPAFVARFKADLARPGLRIPPTADAALFDEAVALGREIVWLNTYGERFADAKAGRHAAPPRLPKAQTPTIPSGGATCGDADRMPDTIDYDAATQTLKIGDTGRIERVTPAVWAYEVSGKRVVTQWFGGRKKDRGKPPMGDRRPPSKLGDIQPDGWPAEYTTDLLNLLNVLGRLVALEPRQADLLGRICEARTVDATAVADALATMPNVKRSFDDSDEPVLPFGL